MYAPLGTYQGPWTLLHAEADEDATALDLAGYKWLYAEISDADGATGTQADDVSTYYAFY